MPARAGRACFPFMTGHVFHPTGVLAMLGVALGCALVAAARREPEVSADPVRG